MTLLNKDKQFTVHTVLYIFYSKKWFDFVERQPLTCWKEPPIVAVGSGNTYPTSNSYEFLILLEGNSIIAGRIKNNIIAQKSINRVKRLEFGKPNILLTKSSLPFIEPKQGYFSSVRFDDVQLGGEGLCETKKKNIIKITEDRNNNNNGW
jgi:hypothetical protein